MFVYSMRAGTIKLIGIVCVALTVLIIALIVGYHLHHAHCIRTHLHHLLSGIRHRRRAPLFL